jgi:4-amino-4-deoxy-L-arabinose transferase-like glycosyltransferase
LDGVEGGFAGYLLLLLLGALALWLSWRWVAARGGPAWLPYAIAGAVLVRLVVGLALHRSLPVFGYPESEQHQAGYYYLDAMLRDEDAWQVAAAEGPLTRAFTESWRADQYGGLLFLSALTYRTLSPDLHRPLMIVVLGSIASGLGVSFAWAFTKAAFGRRAAAFAAWGLVLYPEAVILGSTQMREPFLISILAAALYGLMLVRDGEQRSGISLALIVLAFGALISPPYMLIFAVVLVTAWLWEGRGAGARLAILAAAVAVVGVALTAGAWGQIEQAPQGSLLGLIDWWLVSGARFELHRLEAGSGFVQKLFELAPEWAHLPMATGNGLVQPFLPATLLDSTSLPLPRLIGIVRGLGWFALLPFLIYAPFAAVRTAGWRSLQAYLAALVWLTAIGASFRLAGDQWDNPRARAVFLVGQLALAGWAWVHASRERSKWLGRAGIVVVGSTLIFLQWYAGRYYQTPRFNLNETVALVGGFVVLYLGGTIVWEAYRNRRLTLSPPEV